MRILAAALAMLALAAGAAQAQDCGLKQYDSIAMEVYPDHLLLPVTFGPGGVQKKMVFRMGDATSGIATDVAKALDMRETSVPPHLTFHRDGNVVNYIAHAEQMQLGRQNLKNMEFLMLRAGRYGDEAAGDIGTRLFENVDFELDMTNRQLNLFSPDHCPGQTVYWTKTGFAKLPIKPSPELGYIRVAVMLDGQPLTVALSTEGRSRIGMNAMRRLFNVDATSPDLVAVNQDLMGNKLYRYGFKTLTADGLTINNPNILVYDEEPKPECKDKLHFAYPEHDPLHATERAELARCFGGEDAVLGLSVLSKLHLYVSSKEKLLYLTGADAK